MDEVDLSNHCIFVFTTIVGKPRKQSLYVVEVSTKEISDLELEAADLFPDSFNPSGDEPTCETFHAHLAATEAEANEQKSAQKESGVTLETVGVSHDFIVKLPATVDSKL